MRRGVIFLTLFLAASGLPGAEQCKVASTNALIRVQCRAVTRSGIRCKRHAAANENYCKQHSAARKPKKPEPKCRAMSSDSKQCDNAPLSGNFYCSEHIK